jgi:hypothetical protein
LPEGLRAVAVINAGVSTQGLKQDEREAKWSIMAADMIEAMLQAGSGMSATPIAVAKRSETQAVLREHDLALAGMVAGDQAAQAGRLLAVQGLITSRITINIDEQRGSKSTIDWMSIMGGAMREAVQGRGEPPPPPPGRGPVVVQRRPTAEVRRTPDGRPYVVQRQGPPALVYRRNPAQIYDPRMQRAYRQERSVAGGGVTFQTKQVEEISRHLTVQCSFTLLDAATGQALVQFSPPPIQKHDRKSPDFFFGGVMGEKDLDPVDHFIGELVEQATREFVSMIVPVQVSTTYELVGKHSAAEDALRALRGDDFAGAMAGFEKELRKYPDEHESMFAMGAVSELTGRFEQALQYYRRALAGKGLDEDELALYTTAKERLSQHLGRILPAGTGANAQPAPAGAPNGAVPAAAPAPPPSPAPAPAVPGQVPAPIIEESPLPRN